jgi:hypothetical protein
MTYLRFDHEVLNWLCNWQLKDSTRHNCVLYIT